MNYSDVKDLLSLAILAINYDYYYGEWKMLLKENKKFDKFTEDKLIAIWQLAINIKNIQEFINERKYK